MSTPINDGGPAFPVTPTDRSGQIADTFPGMTLRDYFAGQALAGMLGNATTTEHPGYDREGLSGECYHIAAAMLAAREGQK